MFRRTVLSMFVLLLTILPQWLAESQDSQPDTYPPVTIPNTESIPLTSTNGREYDIMVALPADYGSDPDQEYPVVYLLYGNFHFGAISNFMRVQNIFGELPSLIIVGIGYPGNPGERIMGELGQSPDEFLGFIADELIPFVDERYQTNPSDRTLMGPSLGGNFVLYSLFSQPNLFSRYIAAGPDLTSNEVMMMEEDFAAQHSELPVSLFISAGDIGDDVVLSEQLFTTMQSRDYDGLRSEYRIIEDATHTSSAVPGFIYGLRFVYDS